MSFDEQMRDALKTFVIESLELLQDMEESLLGLEVDPEPAERINAIFRAAHTIKGSAGLFGLDHIVAFTHVVESVLDTLRDGKLSVSPELVAALLPCCDHMIELIQGVADGKVDAEPSLSTAQRQLLEELESFLKPEPKQAMTAVSDTEDRIEASGGGAIDSGNWHLFIQFGENCLRDGMDPLSFIRYLATLGQIVTLTTFSHAMPDADNMDPETSYLGFEIVLKSDADKATIESVFDFVRDGSYIHILPLENRIPYYVELIESLGEDNAQLGELLLKSGVITQRELQEGLNAQQDQAVQPSARIGEILVEQQVVQQPLVNAALEKQQQIKDHKARENQSIRVDAERLDKLIDLIGECRLPAGKIVSHPWLAIAPTPPRDCLRRPWPSASPRL